ncbi:MAG: transporter substrate-binding domain-containing protein [Rhodospirillales bacterium]|nr:transporter substrate-binding domain-containing protein [Rhodospirillales bacterium]
MKLSICAVSFLVLLCTIPFSAFAIEMAINEWKPYTVEKNGELEGVAVDKANKIFSQMGIELTISNLPFRRALMLAEKGMLGGVLLSANKPSRHSYMAFSSPIFCDRRFLFTLKNQTFNWGSLKELKGKTLGTGNGFYNGPTVQKWVDEKTVKTIEVSSTLSLLKMLVSKRVDFITFSEREFNSLMGENPHFASNIVRLEPPVYEAELRLGFTLSRNGKKNSELSRKAIAQLGLGETCK